MTYTYIRSVMRGGNVVVVVDNKQLALGPLANISDRLRRASGDACE